MHTNMWISWNNNGNRSFWWKPFGNKVYFAVSWNEKRKKKLWLNGSWHITTMKKKKKKKNGIHYIFSLFNIRLYGLISNGNKHYKYLCFSELSHLINDMKSNSISELLHSNRIWCWLITHKKRSYAHAANEFFFKMEIDK